MLERAANAGQKPGVADCVNERTAGDELRSSNPLHYSVGPADEARCSDGDHCLLHGVEHDGQFVAAAFELGEVLVEALGGLIQCILHGGKLVSAVRIEARAQIAAGDAASKSNNALETPGDAKCEPGGNGNGDGE